MKEIANNPHYRPILRVLISQQGAPISHQEISLKAQISRVTVVRHLRLLRTVGVVYWEGKRGQGQCFAYHVDPMLERLVSAS